MPVISEYLAASYHPDCEYVDGAIVERNVGEYDHSRLVAAVVTCLHTRRHRYGIHVLISLRVQVSPTRIRIPDVCVIAGPEPGEQVITKPPLICIEILSRDDRLSAVQERVDDFLAFGVRYVWLLDPRKRKAWRCTPGEMREVGELRTESPDITVPLSELFA